jgi:adenylate cyclase class 2
MSRSESMVETEVKLRVDDAAAARARIVAAGFAEAVARQFEVNLVYDRPSGEIRARGELLRIRKAGDDVMLTYKGKSHIGPHKSREELEISVSDLAVCDLILRRLDFVQIFRYEKYRTEFQRAGEPGVVTLDETPIGIYLELEGPAEWIDSAAGALGYGRTQYITSSYGKLYTEYCASARIPIGNMVFEPRT